MRTIGTVVRGIRAPIIRKNDNIARIAAESVMEAWKEAGITPCDRDIVAVEGQKTPYLISYIQLWGGWYIAPLNEAGMIERGKRVTIKTALRRGFDFTKTRIVGNQHDMEDALIKFDVWLGQQQQEL